MPPFHSLAVAQTIPIAGDVAANLAQHTKLVRIAAEAGAHAVVFPELSLTGYELERAADLAFSPMDTRLGPLVDQASALQMALVVGAPVEVASRLHIGAFIVHPDGSLDLYTKQRLGAFPASASPDGTVPPPEATIFEPGESDPSIRIGGTTAAIAICADTGDASHPAAAARRGARIYLASMFVIPADLDSEASALRSYAVQHSLIVAFANFGGPSGGLPSAGKSTIWSDRGDLLIQLPNRGGGVAVASEQCAGWKTRGAAVALT